MTEKWHPQRKTADASIAMLKTFVHHLEHPISRSTIETTVEKHPEFPQLSFGAITEILKGWGMQPISYQMPLEKIFEIPVPSITLIHETYRGLKMGSLILYFGTDGTEVRYVHPRKGWVYESLIEFSKKWSNAMISLEGIDGNGEQDFAEKESAYEKNLVENPDRNILKHIENFVTSEQCDHIIKLSENKFNESKVVGDVDMLRGRTSYTADLPFNNDPILSQVRLKASELLKLPVTHFEFFQCVSYENGQEYQNHFDTFDPNTQSGQDCLKDGGQRKHTILVYLNDEFEGGQTYFPKLDVLFDPKKGDAVLFDNIDENKNVIEASWHAGLPVAKGRKFALNIWVRENPIKNL